MPTRASADRRRFLCKRAQTCRASPVPRIRRTWSVSYVSASLRAGRSPFSRFSHAVKSFTTASQCCHGGLAHQSRRDAKARPPLELPLCLRDQHLEPADRPAAGRLCVAQKTRLRRVVHKVVDKTSGERSVRQRRLVVTGPHADGRCVDENVPASRWRWTTADLRSGGTSNLLGLLEPSCADGQFRADGSKRFGHGACGAARAEHSDSRIAERSGRLKRRKN